MNSYVGMTMVKKKEQGQDDSQSTKHTSHIISQHKFSSTYVGW